MFQHIVVALDGSQLAERVLPYVEELAAKFGSKLVLVRSTPPVERSGAALAAAEGALTIDPTAWVDQERAEAESYLTDISNRLRERRIAVETAQPEGVAAQVIAQEARRSGADLIAMTTHGAGGLGRLLFGSVADEVLRTAPCPVLLVRVHEQGARWLENP
jgi:nucleotide-binding universal stress UspA family protein